MQQKDFISCRYTNRHFSSGGSVFRDVHWLNFGWGEEVDPVSGKVTLVHHPNEVWMRCTYSDREHWKKVKILKESPGSVLLEQLYHAPLVLKPAKVRDLKNDGSGSYCVVPENIHTPPTEGFFQFDPPPHWIFRSRGLHVTPPTPWNFHDFSTWCPIPLGKKETVIRAVIKISFSQKRPWKF